MIEKVQAKKQENSKKYSELADLQKENIHMHAHLNKLKSTYLSSTRKLQSTHWSNW